MYSTNTSGDSFVVAFCSFELSRYERSFANEILAYEGEALEVKLCQPNHQRALNDTNDLLRVDGLLEQRDSETETNDGVRFFRATCNDF